VLLGLETETELASETPCFFRKLDIGQSPRQENGISNFSRAVFSLWISWLLKIGPIGFPGYWYEITTLRSIIT